MRNQLKIRTKSRYSLLVVNDFEYKNSLIEWENTAYLNDETEQNKYSVNIVSTYCLNNDDINNFRMRLLQTPCSYE